MLAGPEVERSRGEFVDQRFCASVFRQVHCLDIRLARLAALHSDVIEIAGGKDLEPFVIFFAASRTNHGARTAISPLAQYAESGLAITERTKSVRDRTGMQLGSGTQQFSVGLKKSLRKQPLSSGRRMRD